MVYDSYEFGKYLSELRRKDKLSMNVVCDGICDVSVMSRIENGEKEVSKIVQDRLLGRLGVAPENYENMVFSDEYERWELRQNIISLIQHEKMGEADRLLEYMSESGRLKDRCGLVEDLDAKLEMQFYLSMKAQIMCYRHADEKELRKIYAEAVRQTVTGFENKQSSKDFFASKRLSVEELNLLIEYGRFLPIDKGIGFLKGIVNHISNIRLDKLAKAKVYPKAVYCLYMFERKKDIQKDKKIKQLIELATEAIECLRDSLRAFYLCELLDMKMTLISIACGENTDIWDLMTSDMEKDLLINEDYMNCYGNTSEFSMESQYIWCRHVRHVLHDIYFRCGVREDTFEYSYIYVDREVYCIEDVIRIRRKMLKMSMADLSDGICSERTISRIERKMTKPQCANVHKLFEKLGLSGELSRSELITSNVKAQELLERVRDNVNYKKNYDVDTMLCDIERMIQMDLPENRQIIKRIKANCKKNRGEITDEEFVVLIKEALQCTVPYDIAVSDGEKYLTIEELSCLHNIMVIKKTNTPEMLECYRTMRKMYEQKEDKINNYLSMYEFVMRPIASYMGDCGMYDESDEKEMFILQNTMRNRRLTVVYSSIYSMLWNDKQRLKKKIAMHRDIAWKEEIKNCIVLSNLAKNIGKNNFFARNLNK